MFLLLPLILAALCFYKKDTRMIPVIFIGLIAGVLVCGFKAFFLYSHRIIPYSFSENVVFLLIRQTLLPVALVYGLFCLWSRDTFEFKAESFCPLLLSFYALYLPYTIISTADHIYTSFSLLIKPCLFCAMILILAMLMGKLQISVAKKKNGFAVLWGILFLAAVVVPSFIEGMFIMDMNYFLVIILSVIYCVTAPVLFWLKKKGA